MSYIVQLSLPIESDWSADVYERDEIIRALSLTVKELELCEGDPLVRELQSYRESLKATPGDEKMRAKMLKAAEDRVKRDSPAFAFRVPLRDGGYLEGLAKPWSILLTAEISPPADVHEGVVRALRSIGRGSLLIHGFHPPSEPDSSTF